MLLASLAAGAVFAQSNLRTNGMLIFTKTAGYRHGSIEHGTEVVTKLAEKNGFFVRHTEDASLFTKDRLRNYKIVVFLNTTGDIFTSDQEQAMEWYVRNGGGFLGIHAAADTEYDWPFYGELVGGWFMSHPSVQEATIKVVDRLHISTKHLPERWVRTDEWYDYKAQPAKDVHILCELDTNSYQGHKMGNPHPIAWCHDKFGGRAFYTGGGHTSEAYDEVDFQKHLLGAIQWVTQQVK